MPTRTDSRLYAQADAFRDALDRQSGAAADDMARAWLVAQQRVNVEISALVAKIAAAKEAGVPLSPAWLYQERRLSSLTSVIRAETLRWSPYAEQTTRDLVRQSVVESFAASKSLATEAASIHLSGVEAAFTDIQPAVLNSLQAHLAEGGPLRQLLNGYGVEASNAAQAALIQGLATGKGGDWITRELRRAAGIPANRAAVLARTEALRAYRETARRTYKESKVVGSWVWHAALDRRTCPACVIMHGTEHPLEEPLDGHPQCRCAMVPRTPSWGELDPSLADLPDTRPPIQTGKDWLSGQTEATQRGILGPGKYDAWKSGKVGLDEMVARTYSPDWGTMRRERSLLEIAQGRNPNVLPPQAAKAIAQAAEEAVEAVEEVVEGFLATLPRKPPGLVRRGLDTPENDLKATNPNYDQGRRYQVNCTNCVSAHELRRRGFNVQAAGYDNGNGRQLLDWGKRWGLKGSDMIAGKMTVLQMKKAANAWPEGARGSVTVVWKGRGSGSHIFTVEKRDGRLVFLDPQTGKDLADGSAYFSRSQNHVYLFRMDNLTPTDGAADFLT